MTLVFLRAPWERESNEVSWHRSEMKKAKLRGKLMRNESERPAEVHR